MPVTCVRQYGSRESGLRFVFVPMYMLYNLKTILSLQCEGDCEGSGLQRREVHCRWRGTAVSAGDECDNRMRPAAEQTCKPASCSGEYFRYQIAQIIRPLNHSVSLWQVLIVRTNRVIAAWRAVWTCASLTSTKKSAVSAAP